MIALFKSDNIKLIVVKHGTNIMKYLILLQLLTNSLISGSIYALISAGFSLTFSACGFFNFAHGAIITVGAYCFYTLTMQLHINFLESIIFTLFFSGITGWIINRFVYRFLRHRNVSNPIMVIASLALLIISESIISILFGADVKSIKSNSIAKTIDLQTVKITYLQVVSIISSFVVFILFVLIMYKTKIGKAIRAITNNKIMAEIVGISSEKVYSLSIVIGSIVAGIISIILALEQNITPYVGSNLVFKGFVASIIGGIGHIPGAILGAFLLGLIENVGVWFLPSGYKDAISVALLVLFLLYRPQGFFGVVRSNEKTC